MKNNHEVELKLTEKELALVHTAICNYRGKLGNLMGQMAEMDLATDDAREVWDLLGSLSSRMCDLLDEDE